MLRMGSNTKTDCDVFKSAWCYAMLAMGSDTMHKNQAATTLNFS